MSQTILVKSSFQSTLLRSSKSSCLEIRMPMVNFDLYDRLGDEASLTVFRPRTNTRLKNPMNRCRTAGEPRNIRNLNTRYCISFFNASRATATCASLVCEAWKCERKSW